MEQTKRKPMTKRERKTRAAVKKELQEEGILPPDKKRLNRKKFAREVTEAWQIEMDLFDAADAYYMETAISFMVGRVMGRVTEEEVGALKLLKIAMEIKKFQEKRKEEGQGSYTLAEFYEQAVEPTLKL